MEHHTPPTTRYPDAQQRRRTVLVVVMNNPADLRRAASEGWYRIPQRRAPRRIAADYLAFYQTGAFKGAPEAHTITYYAPVRRYRLLTRAELLPEEADHPRADDYYFRIEIGPLMRLDRPVPAARYRRITFIHTTLDRLMSAEDVTDLRRDDEPFDMLWRALRENRLRPLANRLAGEWPADIALRARSGYVGIRCVETEDAVRDRMLPEGWHMVHLAEDHIRADLPACLRQVAAALIELGGSADARPGPEWRG